MAEIRVNVTASKPQRVNVSSSNISTEITATPDSSLYYSNLAKNWAIASGLVLNEDYSSKHYAEKAKESENASKNYAEASQAVYQRVQDSANDVLDNIETNKNSAIEEIETIKTNAVNTANEANTTINTNKTNAINEINTTKNSAVSSVNTTKTSAITEINNTKTTAVNAVNTSKNQAISDIEKESSSIVNFKEEVNAELENKVDLDDMVEINLGNSFELFDTKLTDHVLTYEETKGWALQGTYVYKNALAGSRYGYPDFYNKVLEEYSQATTTETVNGVTVKVHSNGHKFYDIADKIGIDDFFNTMGSAWFYGVDTENERIFLPRDNNKIHGELIENIVDGTKWCRIYSDGCCEQGCSEIAGGTTITLLKPFKDTNYTVVVTPNARAGTMTGGYCSKTSNSQVYYQPCYRTGDGQGNSTVKGSVYACGYTTVVQPYEVEKYYYICVGNTTNYEGVTEVVNQGMEILEQVNEGIESRVAKESMQEVPCITETYVNGTSWYRIYSDGWCEQGGYCSGNATVTYLKPFIDTNYSLVGGLIGGDASKTYEHENFNSQTNESFVFVTYDSYKCKWYACGYIA